MLGFVHKAEWYPSFRDFSEIIRVTISQTVAKHTYSNWKKLTKALPACGCCCLIKANRESKQPFCATTTLRPNGTAPNKRWIHGWYIAILKKLCNLPSNLFCCCTSVPVLRVCLAKPKPTKHLLQHVNAVQSPNWRICSECWHDVDDGSPHNNVLVA